MVVSGVILVIGLSMAFMLLLAMHIRTRRRLHHCHKLTIQVSAYSLAHL